MYQYEMCAALFLVNFQSKSHIIGRWWDLLWEEFMAEFSVRNLSTQRRLSSWSKQTTTRRTSTLLRKTARKSWTGSTRPPSSAMPTPKRRSANCRFLHLLYVAPQAHAEYEALLHDAREGIPLNRASFYKQDRIISSCIEKGPHIYYRRFSPRAQCVSQHGLSAFFQGILFGFQDSPSTRRKVQASQKEAGGCRSFRHKEGTPLCGFPRSYGTGRA